MLKRLLPALALAATVTTGAFAQNHEHSRACATMDHLNAQMQADPTLATRMAEQEKQIQRILSNQQEMVTGTVTIPVVVHVVYNNSTENISDAQINSQIAVLNQDFRKTNSDAGQVPSVFASRAADAEIEFVLDQVVRVATSKTSFGTDDQMKSSSTGGSNAISPSTKLNMWVCDISGGILGYAQFPNTGSLSTDGVVMDYQYFGTTGTATAPFNKGRTATHEVGHWLNLRHIWGDGNCNQDDFVSDTPTAGNPNYGCPSLGTNSCSGGDYDMWMNYMDYVDDACMYMFTSGQKARMRATFEAGGGREGFASGSGGGGGGGGTTCTPVPGNVTLTLTTDNYGSETTWSLVNGSGSTVASGSGYANNTTITETFTLADGDYTFTINDSYGDGICCSYGNGSYALTDGNGGTIVSGGSFTSSESTDFCIQGTAGGGGGGGGTTNDCGAASNISASRTQWKYYTWNVPTGTQELTVAISGGSGDADLYVRQGSSNPTTSAYDCRPYLSGNNESCSFDNPTAGEWKIGIRAYAAFSGVTLDVCNNGVPARMTFNEHGQLVYEGEVAGANLADIVAFPNPVQDVLSLQLNGDIADNAVIRIVSISGKEMMRSNMAALKSGINVAELPEGMYVITTTDAKDNPVSTKFVKQ